ncbi:hypothetical protein HC752_21115 [Vibrio sp. S9_S30]|uniref:hypothetical protein n=1 Tax=Vibrio sp. S9_S30 TaxID=2720226 RepID=UPI00168142D0|nr:hypothetical protein [Vibrio sp. S9_S30]MBD1559447.1 hypothetical protein [Vibrio sp. S9_S30]
MEWFIGLEYIEYCEFINDMTPCVHQTVSEITRHIMRVYVALGSLVTLYVLGFFVATGVTVFDDGVKQKMSLRLKMSYVLVMGCLFPIFYAPFLNDVRQMKSRYAERRSKHTVILEGKY